MDRHGLALVLFIAIAFVAVPLNAKPISEFSHNVIDRPLVLGQEIFERGISNTLQYYEFDGSDDNDYYDEEDTDKHLGNIYSTAHVAVGLTDWLQLKFSGTMSWSEPDMEFLSPTLEIAGLPIKYVSPYLALIGPDTVQDEGYGWQLGVRGRYQILPAKLAIYGDISYKRFGYEGYDDYSFTETTYQAIFGARYALSSRFFAGVFAGTSKFALESDDDDFKEYGGYEDPDVGFGYGIEVGFMSIKHVGIVLRWGAPVQPGMEHVSFKFASLDITGRF